MSKAIMNPRIIDRHIEKIINLTGKSKFFEYLYVILLSSPFFVLVFLDTPLWIDFIIISFLSIGALFSFVERRDTIRNIENERENIKEMVNSYELTIKQMIDEKREYEYFKSLGLDK